eukprot:TRINITY_DN2264_c0_g1_i3.p1 TRINITY_DN2264_c0_g1~~TRINITY_DN2264_c0_g1_i3.p1  ORF type:complete len:1409 (+),score=408.49 TRINITY_DN2264_c0_g1_i3:529-4227(+)
MNDLGSIMALCSAADPADVDKIAPAIVHIFEYQNLTQHLLRQAILNEVKLTVSATILFRANSIAAKMVSVAGRMMGSSFLKKLLAPLINEVIQHPVGYEVNPERDDIYNDSASLDLMSNANRLMQLSKIFLEKIVESFDECPRGIREICIHFKTIAGEKFPGDYWKSIVGGFFFLRFVCPAIVAPAAFGIVDEPPEKEAQRVLVLVSKILQNLANGKEFHEPYMIPFNQFLSDYTPLLHHFFDKLTSSAGNAPASGTVPSPADVLSDVLMLVRYIKIYRPQLTAQEEADSMIPSVLTDLFVVMDKMEEDKQQIIKPYNIETKELVTKGALKIQHQTTELETEGMSTDDEILNSGLWTEPPRDLCEVASDLLAKIYRLYLSQMRVKEPQVNWGAIARISKDFKRFVDASAELQRVTLQDVCYPGRVTFWINIYNCLVLHLHCTMGPPDSLFRRNAFFSQYKYNIAGLHYSLNDILHGILRGNPKNPITRHRQFRSYDPRRAYVLPLDPRIHFAVSLLNKSSPFMRMYKAKTIEEELQRAGEIFMKSECVISLGKKEVMLPKLFEKYPSDFPKRRNEELTKWIFQFLSNKNRLDLMLLLEWGNYGMVFQGYSWMQHSKEATKASAESDVEFFTGALETTRRGSTVARLKTLIVGEQQRRSIVQMALLVEELENSGISDSLNSDRAPRSYRRSIVGASLGTGKSIEVSSTVEKEALFKLKNAIRSAALEVSQMFSGINAQVMEIDSVEIMLQIAKLVKGTVKELREFSGTPMPYLSTAQIQIKQRSGTSTVVPSFQQIKDSSGQRLADDLSDRQKKALPMDKQGKFLQLIRAVQSMLIDVQYVLGKLLLTLDNFVMQSEVLSLGGLISRIGKETRNMSDSFRGTVRDDKRADELAKITALRSTIQIQIENALDLIDLVQIASRVREDNPAVLNSNDELFSVYNTARILRYVKRQLFDTNPSTDQMEEFAMEDANRIVLDKPRLIELAKILPSTIAEVMLELESWKKKVGQSKESELSRMGLQVRNIKHAMSSIKGKREKRATKLNVRFDDSAFLDLTTSSDSRQSTSRPVGNLGPTLRPYASVNSRLMERSRSDTRLYPHKIEQRTGSPSSSPGSSFIGSGKSSEKRLDEERNERKRIAGELEAQKKKNIELEDSFRKLQDQYHESISALEKGKHHLQQKLNRPPYNAGPLSPPQTPQSASPVSSPPASSSPGSSPMSSPSVPRMNASRSWGTLR